MVFFFTPIHTLVPRIYLRQVISQTMQDSTRELELPLHPQPGSVEEFEVFKQNLADAERKLGSVLVKNNDRIEVTDGYYVGESPDGKKMHGFGTLYLNNGSRYEGQMVDNKFNGAGMTYHHRHIPNTSGHRQLTKMLWCIILLALLLCIVCKWVGGGK